MQNHFSTFIRASTVLNRLPYCRRMDVVESASSQSFCSTLRSSPTSSHGLLAVRKNPCTALQCSTGQLRYNTEWLYSTFFTWRVSSAVLARTVAVLCTSTWTNPRKFRHYCTTIIQSEHFSTTKIPPTNRRPSGQSPKAYFNIHVVTCRLDLSVLVCSQ